MSAQSLRVRQLNPAALATERRAHIPRQYSAFIHLWRIVATAAVFIGHATKPDILFDIDVAIIGRATIPTFLLISGYFTTLSMYSGGRFLKKVAKRYYIMLTMFVPASFLIFCMDLYMVQAGAPILTIYKFDPDLSFGRVLIDVFNLFTFSGEYWSQSTVGQGVFSNQAIWIIDYIMAYTVMTAALYLLSGWVRVVTILGVMAIAGVPVTPAVATLVRRRARLRITVPLLWTGWRRTRPMASDNARVPRLHYAPRHRRENACLHRHGGGNSSKHRNSKSVVPARPCMAGQSCLRRMTTGNISVWPSGSCGSGCTYLRSSS